MLTICAEVERLIKMGWEVFLCLRPRLSTVYSNIIIQAQFEWKHKVNLRQTFNPLRTSVCLTDDSSTGVSSVATNCFVCISGNCWEAESVGASGNADKLCNLTSKRVSYLTHIFPSHRSKISVHPYLGLQEAQLLQGSWL